MPAKVPDVLPRYHAQAVYDLQWSPDGSRLAAGSDESGSASNILIFDRNGALLNTLVGHGTLVDGLDWAPSSGKLLSSSWDGTLRIWDGATGALLMQFGTGAQYVDAQWSADEAEVFAAKRSGDIEVYALTDTVGPSISISAPANNSTTTAASVDVIGQITDPHLVGVAQVRINGSTWLALTLDAEGRFTQSMDLSEGANTIEIQATDGPGNTSTLSLHVTRLVDTTPPTISDVIATPGSGDFCTAFAVSARIVDTWSGLNALSIRLHVQRPDEQDVASLTMYDDGVQGGDATAGDMTWTGTWDSCLAPSEGAYLIDITAADNRGNTRHAENAAVLQVVDAPQISSISHQPASPSDTNPVTINAVITDHSGIGAATLYYAGADTGPWTPESMQRADGNAWQGTVPARDAGAVFFKISASDLQLNSSTSTISSYSVHDASPPTFYGWTETPSDLTEDTVGLFRVQITVLDTGGGGLAGQTPQLAYRIGTGSYGPFADMTNTSGNAWAFDISGDWHALQGQTLTYQVRCSDAVGNLGMSTEQNELIDRVNHRPQIDAAEPVSASPSVMDGSCLLFRLTASDSDGDALSYRWIQDGRVVAQTAEYNYCPGLEQVGTHSISGEVSDGALSSLRNWQVNVTPSALTIVHTPVTGGFENTAIVVTAIVTGPQSPIVATLYYRTLRDDRRHRAAHEPHHRPYLRSAHPAGSCDRGRPRLLHRRD